MLGTAVASPSSPQVGAAGTHAFDPNGDVAGNGFDICTFHLHDHDGETHVELECHSSWGLFEGLIDNGIPVVVDDCPFSDEDFCNSEKIIEDCDEGETSLEGENCAGHIVEYCGTDSANFLSLIHISEPTRPY